MAWLVSPSGMLENVDGSMEFWSGSVDAAEAKKAEGASITALLILKPPAITGRLACDHWMSSKSTSSTRTASNLLNSEMSLQGDVLRVYNNLDLLKQFRRRLWTSWACISDNRSMVLVRSSILELNARSMTGL